MKRKSPPKPESHSAKVRASWLEHIKDQRTSGLRQSEYCRVHGLQPKYFSQWKRRLASELGAADQVVAEYHGYIQADAFPGYVAAKVMWSSLCNHVVLLESIGI